MADSRISLTNQFGLPDYLLVTDSVVLDVESVAKTLGAGRTDVPRGDVIEGLKYGLIISTCIWAVVVLTVYVFIQ